MKNIIVTIVLLSFSSIIHGQMNDLSWTRLKSDATSFQAVVDSFETYIDTTFVDSIPKSRLANIKDFYRFVYFWKSRLGIESDSLSYLPYWEATEDLRDGPYCTGEDPAQWELVGPYDYNLEGGMQNLGLVSAVLHDPLDSDNYILSAEHGGLWKLNSGTNKWYNVTDNLSFPGLSAREIIRNPFAHDHLIAATAGGIHSSKQYGVGIIESFDNGVTWSINENFHYELFPKVTKVAYDPSDDDPSDGLTMYAIGHDEIFMTENTGLTWSVMPGPYLPQFGYYVDLEVNELGQIFVTTCNTYSSSIGKVYKYNAGQWIDVIQTSGITGHIHKATLSQPKGNKMFLNISRLPNEIGWGTREVWKSESYGNNWELIKTFTGVLAGTWTDQIEYSPESNIIYIGSIIMAVFYNDGTYDHETIYPLHADIRDFDIIGVENREERVLVATDGGIELLSVNIDDLTDVEQINLNGDSLPICNMVGLAAANYQGEFIVGGSMHDGTHMNENDSWQYVLAGDGGDCEITKWSYDYFFGLANWSLKKINLQNKQSTTVYSNGHDWYMWRDLEINPLNDSELYFGTSRYSSNGELIPAKLMLYNADNETTIEFEMPEDMEKVGAIEINNDNIIYVANFDIQAPDDTCCLLRSLDNGSTWLDLSKKTVEYYYNGQQTKPLNNVLAWKFVEDIVFNSEQPDEMWLSVSGLKTSSTGVIPGLLRVLHSVDGGESWTDYSENLPAFPAIALEYLPGSDGLVFAGTDAGVYYRDHSMTQWECFNEGLPISIITDLDYDPCSGYLYASTYSRSIHKTPVDFEVTQNQVSLTPGEVTTWDKPVHVWDDMSIPANTTLIIQSNVHVADDKKIIVERGGELIIDGGLITNRCNGMWKGIEVWGTASESPGVPGAHGKVTLQNHAVIENAVCGIRAVKVLDDQQEGTINLAYTGGQINVDNSTIINCVYGIRLYEYEYSYPCTLEEANFLTDRPLNDPEMHPVAMIYLTDVEGVAIQGGTMRNARPYSEVTNEDRGMGVYSYNAGFYIEKKPGGIGHQDEVRIDSLYYGIKAINTIPGKTFTVKSVDFSNNIRGIYSGNVNNILLELNTIYVHDSPPLGIQSYGIYLDGCDGYQVEANSLEYSYDDYPKGIGIIVNNSGTNPNEIYRNSFIKLELGIIAQDNNRGRGTGLELLCNDFALCEADIAVTQSFISGKHGISPYQGSDGNNPEDMAGNLFYIPDLIPDGDFDDINNEANHITYYYPQNTTYYDTKPVDYTINSVTIVETTVGPDGWTPANGCPPGEGIDGTADPDSLRNVLAEAEQKIATTENLLATLVDGGNTDELHTDVQTSIPPETMEVYNELMTESPYLSDTVVSSSIEKEDVLPNAMIRDVMVANPHTAKSDGLMNKLDERLNPLPDYMKAQILQGRSIVSIKEELETDLNASRLKKARAFNGLVRYYLNDSLDAGPAYDSLELLYQQDNLLSSKYRLAMLQLEQGEVQAGMNVLNLIPAHFDLTGQEQIEHQGWTEYYSFLAGLMADSATIWNLDSIYVSQILNLVNTQSGTVGEYARNVLLAIKAINYDEPVILPDVLKTTEAIDDYEELLSKALETPGRIRVYPNPANDYVIIEYELETGGPATIEVRGVDGTDVCNKEIENKKDQVVVKTGDWKPGVYIATLRIKGEVIESTKFTIVN